MAHLDRQRAPRLMRESGVDALVLFQPENFTYATGASAGVAAMWRRAGGAVAIVPSDADVRTTAIVGDLNAAIVASAAPELDVRSHRLWVDTIDVAGVATEDRSTAAIVGEAYGRQSGAPRPTTFDLSAVLHVLGDVLAEMALSRGRVAVDLEFLPAVDYLALLAALPDVRWCDGSAIVRRLRAVKSAAEVGKLRRACALAEAGLVALAGRVGDGQSQAALSAAWRAGVADSAHTSGATDLTGSWDFISVGPDPWASGGSVALGAIIKADVGCVVGGYSSDSARTFVFGKPDPIARDMYAVLSDAFATGLATIRPGALLRDVYAATAHVIHAAGYPGYQRGHFGHGVGASVGSEEWPFISADSDVVIEPNMVLAFETPFYGNGIGALMIEDQMLITENGIDVMNTLPRDLARID